jgi:hypothetical protein
MVTDVNSWVNELAGVYIQGAILQLGLQKEESNEIFLSEMLEDSTNWISRIRKYGSDAKDSKRL